MYLARNRIRKGQHLRRPRLRLRSGQLAAQPGRLLGERVPHGADGRRCRLQYSSNLRFTCLSNIESTQVRLAKTS